MGAHHVEELGMVLLRIQARQVQHHRAPDRQPMARLETGSVAAQCIGGIRGRLVRQAMTVEELGGHALGRQHCAGVHPAQRGDRALLERRVLAHQVQAHRVDKKLCHDAGVRRPSTVEIFQTQERPRVGRADADHDLVATGFDHPSQLVAAVGGVAFRTGRDVQRMDADSAVLIALPLGRGARGDLQRVASPR